MNLNKLWPQRHNVPTSSALEGGPDPRSTLLNTCRNLRAALAQFEQLLAAPHTPTPTELAEFDADIVDIEAAIRALLLERGLSSAEIDEYTAQLVAEDERQRGIYN